MKTVEMENLATAVQTIRLVDGDFTPSDASDIIYSLIDKKINFHKIQRLQSWERNNKCDLEPINCRISELELEKQHAKEIINHLRSTGKRIKINGTIEITAVD